MKEFFISLTIISLIMQNKRSFSQKPSSESTKRLFAVEELDQAELLPENALSIEISFVNKKKPLKRGWWLFSKDQLYVSITLSNSLDSNLYVPPIGDLNPTFIIEGKRGGKEAIPKIIDFVPKKFHKIEPKSVYKDTVDVLRNYDYRFIESEEYELMAIFSNRWAAFKDEEGKTHKIWAGRIQSNVLTFTYPD